MTKHEIEEAVNQGQCRLDIERGSDRVKIVLTGPDEAPVAAGEQALPAESGLSHVRDALRDAYRDLFNKTESWYSQKLCRVTAIRVTVADTARIQDVLPLASDGLGSVTLSEEAARLLDPLGNLRPGVPVTLRDGTETAPDPDKT